LATREAFLTEGVHVSWSVSFTSKTVAAAKRKVNLDTSLGLPPVVRVLIADALSGIADKTDQVISVTGHGHQASGEDYAVSSVTLEVKPIILTS
jgi:hypothetical protein